jgi:DNA-damage-inducible protein D
LKVINRAKEACLNSEIDVADHFTEVSKMVDIGSGTMRAVEDFELSRYACYLIVQNADARKKIVALGQSYFAVQTRRQELADQFTQLDEDQKRLQVRQDLKEHNKKLVEAAKQAGVETPVEYAVFQDHGYMGLYGGLRARDIHTRKQLQKNEKILDHMGSTELAANLFRATQTEDKLRRDQIQGKSEANQTHRLVGAKVRQTIAELGGTMPEDLPVPEKSAKKLESEQNKRLKGGDGE